MVVIDIRGANGSGKSYLVHSLLKSTKHQSIMGIARDKDGKSLGRKHLGYYLPRYNTSVLGKYDNVCGGCDGVGSPNEVVRRVKLFVKKHRHVVLEGILVAHTWKRYYDLSQHLANYGLP